MERCLPTISTPRTEETIGTACDCMRLHATAVQVGTKYEDTDIIDSLLPTGTKKLWTAKCEESSFKLVARIFGGA